tara:strand:- start:1103 stop:1522 length:420 start_codon:yes stop_codon:yes gene_type:complete
MADKTITVDTLSGVAKECDLTILGGADFNNTFTIKNPNGTALNMQQGAGSTAGLGVTWTGSSQMTRSVAVGATLGVTTTFNVGFTSAAGGVLKISLGSTDTRNLEQGRYVYDILVGSGNTIFRLVQGNITVQAGVSSAP